MQLSVFVAEKSGETKNTWFKNTNTTRTTTTSWESESRTACCRCVPAKKPEPHPFLLSPKKQRQPSKFCKMQQSCTHWEMTWSHDPRRVGIFLCPVPVTSNQNVSSGGWFLQSVTQKLLVDSAGHVQSDMAELLTWAKAWKGRWVDTIKCGHAAALHLILTLEWFLTASHYLTLPPITRWRTQLSVFVVRIQSEPGKKSGLSRKTL